METMADNTAEKIDKILNEFREEQLKKVSERVELLEDFVTRVAKSGDFVTQEGTLNRVKWGVSGDRFSRGKTGKLGDLSLPKSPSGLVCFPAPAGAAGAAGARD